MKSRNTGSAKIDLLLISGLALYAESVLIRWMGAEIRMFAYLKNFTLLAAFLGLGLGMLRRRDSRGAASSGVSTATSYTFALRIRST